VQYSSDVVVAVEPSLVHPYVADLARYVEWMPMVHDAEVVDDGVWNVELRAKVGVFARSKRLRMKRTVNTSQHIVFERDEVDGRRHSPWTMAIALQTADVGCVVTVNLSYGGSLWTAGILDRVLAAQVEAGKTGLARVVHGS
jgi:ribosome-associated toxin RatA of RatAB toxin-antitoxin module